MAAEFLGFSFTLDGSEHRVNNHTKTAAAKQVKYLVGIIVGLGLPPEVSGRNLMTKLWEGRKGLIMAAACKVEKITVRNLFII